MSLVIKAENLSKAYQLGEFSTGTLSRDIERWWAKVNGKEDPFLKIGEVNDRTRSGASDIVWSLKDISFDIHQGEAVGIIGRNGAGKSTLLKVLSRVTSPTSGGVKIKGRVASLLEVGTGFHPELTGRENIFLNGTILGMRKVEIKKHFDAIVDFAGVERYIDTPVKRYSSGMYVRLAFAVAAHLESEILIVDEVLAVGDAEFQKKCLGKMGDVSSKEGRTVLFVSHNTGAVQSLCKSCILMDKGQVLKQGRTAEIISFYQNVKPKHELDNAGIIKQLEVKFDGKSIKIVINLGLQYALNRFNIGVIVKNSLLHPIFGVNNKIDDYENYLKLDNFLSGVVELEINNPVLIDGEYFISLYLGDGEEDILVLEDFHSFHISQWCKYPNFDQNFTGNVYPKCTWNIIKN